MERLRFHSTGEEDEYHPTRPLNSEAGIMQELKPESTNNDTEEANKAGSSTVGGKLLVHLRYITNEVSSIVMKNNMIQVL